jgi:hypothetical protein
MQKAVAPLALEQRPQLGLGTRLRRASRRSRDRRPNSTGADRGGTTRVACPSQLAQIRGRLGRISAISRSRAVPNRAGPTRSVNSSRRERFVARVPNNGSQWCGRIATAEGKTCPRNAPGFGARLFAVMRRVARASLPLVVVTWAAPCRLADRAPGDPPPPRRRSRLSRRDRGHGSRVMLRSGPAVARSLPAPAVRQHRPSTPAPLHTRDNRGRVTALPRISADCEETAGRARPGPPPIAAPALGRSRARAGRVAARPRVEHAHRELRLVDCRKMA